jgi:hypothetical protein
VRKSSGHVGIIDETDIGVKRNDEESVLLDASKSDDDKIDGSLPNKTTQGNDITPTGEDKQKSVSNMTAAKEDDLPKQTKVEIHNTIEKKTQIINLILSAATALSKRIATKQCLEVDEYRHLTVRLDEFLERLDMVQSCGLDEIRHVRRQAITTVQQYIDALEQKDPHTGANNREEPQNVNKRQSEEYVQKLPKVQKVH